MSGRTFLITAALIIASPTAGAYFKVGNDSASPHGQIDNECGDSRVTQRGTGSATRLGGQGSGVPLDQALRVLVPQGWRVKTQDDVGRQPVSWNGSQSWLQAIADGTTDQTCLVVDWDNRWVLASLNELLGPIEKHETDGERAGSRYVERKEVDGPTSDYSGDSEQYAQIDADAESVYGQETQPASIPETVEDNASQEQGAGRSDQPDAVSALPEPAIPKPPAEPAPPPEIAFVVDKDQKLSRALERFLETRGWNLAWQSPLDYPVKYGLTLHGRNAIAILDQLKTLYPLKVNVWNGNRVVEIQSASNANQGVSGETR